MNRPTRIMAGEAGPEAIVPIDRLFRELRTVMESQGVQNGSQSSRGDRDVGDIVQAVERLERAINSLELDSAIEVDGRKIADVILSADDRHVSTRLVNK